MTPRACMSSTWCLALMLLTLMTLDVNGFSANLIRPWHYRKDISKIATMTSTTTSRLTTTTAPTWHCFKIHPSSRLYDWTAMSRRAILTATEADEQEPESLNTKDESDSRSSTPINNQRITRRQSSKQSIESLEGEHQPRLFIAPPHSSSTVPINSNTLATNVSIGGSTHSTVNATKTTPTVLTCLPDLYQMTRPSNFPGVVLFHMLGTYLAVKHANTIATTAATISSTTTTTAVAPFSYWSVLLQQPLMWITLVALLLTDATSMLVNDYYDTKLGVDTNNDETKSKNHHNRLVTAQVPMRIAKRFLSMLYAAALICVTMVPGIPARLSIVVALMLTFWYTEHLKPITWLKNAVCAALIALSPLTSGAAALHLLLASLLMQSSSLMSPTILSSTTQPASYIHHVFSISLFLFSNLPLWRLVAMLFCGFFGREIMMDCNDVLEDRLHRVRTVPVQYGRSFASGVAFICTCVASVLAVAGPLWEIQQNLNPILVTAATATANHPPILRWLLSNNWLCRLMTRLLFHNSLQNYRRLLLATLGSLAQLRRAWQVYRTQGEDKLVVDRAVEEGKLSSLLLLGSFL